MADSSSAPAYRIETPRLLLGGSPAAALAAEARAFDAAGRRLF